MIKWRGSNNLREWRVDIDVLLGHLLCNKLSEFGFASGVLSKVTVDQGSVLCIFKRIPLTVFGIRKTGSKKEVVQ